MGRKSDQERDARILALRDWDHFSYSAIGAIEGISKQRVHQILKRLGATKKPTNGVDPAA